MPATNMLFRFFSTLASLLLALTATAQSPVAEEAALQSFRIEYRAETLGLKAEASRQLWQDESGSFVLRNKIEAKPFGVTLAELDERSRFALQGSVLQTQEYSYQQSGLGAQQENVHFDWESASAYSELDGEQKTLALSERVTDKLLFQLQLRRALQQGQTGPFQFTVIDEGKLESQQYSIVGEERISTPLGDFDTVKLQRDREQDSPRSTYFWLAKNWGHLLVAIEQTDGSGRKTTLQIDSGELAGSPLGNDSAQ